MRQRNAWLKELEPRAIASILSLLAELDKRRLRNKPGSLTKETAFHINGYIGSVLSHFDGCWFGPVPAASIAVIAAQLPANTKSRAGCRSGYCGCRSAQCFIIAVRTLICHFKVNDPVKLRRCCLKLLIIVYFAGWLWIICWDSWRRTIWYAWRRHAAELTNRWPVNGSSLLSCRHYAHASRIRTETPAWQQRQYLRHSFVQLTRKDDDRLQTIRVCNRQ